MSPRTIVLLAAGRGNRLAPHTDGRPKCLVPVGDTTPLELLLEQLSALPVAELVIVVGYAREAIDALLERRPTPFPVRTVFNPRWAETNNVVSAELAASRVAGGMLLFNSDVVCDGRIVARAFEEPEASFLVVDPTRPPRDEAMKVRYVDERLVGIAKTLDPGEADGEYIGIAGFDPPGAREFFRSCGAIVARGGEGEWYEAAIAVTASSVPIGRRLTQGLPWIEIDDPEDLARAGQDVLPKVSRKAGNV